MQKMMCCIDSVDCYIDIADIAAHSDTDSISHSGGEDGALQLCIDTVSVLMEKMAHCLKLLHTPGCGGNGGLLLARDWEEIQLNRFSWPLHSTLLPASSE